LPNTASAVSLLYDVREFVGYEMGIGARVRECNGLTERGGTCAEAG